MMSYTCPNGHEVGKRAVITVRCETPGCTARITYEPIAHGLCLRRELATARAALKRAVGCEHPDTCGGPDGQPICEACIAFARAHLWTTAEDPIEGRP